MTESLEQVLDPQPNLKGVFVGSGSDGLSTHDICSAILQLVGKDACNTVVLYIGTATYDLPAPMTKQTERFKEAGCSINVLNISSSEPAEGLMKSAVESADVVIVSGGNTLFAVDRWQKTGLSKLLRTGFERGLVISGGSAGAICWFDGGHSDSMDPDTYKVAMLEPVTVTTITEETAGLSSNRDSIKSWDYIRVDGLGFLPGLVCPHHDRVQSNGVLRSKDFDAMLLRHKGERGICIDHWAAIVVSGSTYRVLSVADKEGSVLQDGSFSPDRRGSPGVWVKEVSPGGHLQSWLAPSSGKLSDLLRRASCIVADPRVDLCRRANPS